MMVEHKWQPSERLRKLAERRGVRIGAARTVGELLEATPQLTVRTRHLIYREYYKWGIHPLGIPCSENLKQDDASELFIDRIRQTVREYRSKSFSKSSLWYVGGFGKGTLAELARVFLNEDL